MLCFTVLGSGSAHREKTLFRPQKVSQSIGESLLGIRCAPSYNMGTPIVACCGSRERSNFRGYMSRRW